MGLEQLEVLVAVADTGSVLGAAEKLRASRGLVRRHLQWLEQRAEVPLLRITRQGAELTEAGQALAARGRTLVATANGLLDHARDIGKRPSGVLKLALPTGPAPGIFLAATRMLDVALQDARAELFLVEHPARLLPGVAEMALTFERHVPDECLALEVARFPTRLMASPGYLESRGTPKNVTDLVHHDLGAWRPPDADARLLPMRDGTWVRIAPRVVLDDVHLLRALAQDGRGLVFLPDMPQPEPGTLVPVLEDAVGGEVVMRLLVPHALADVPRVKVILDGVRAAVSG